MKFEEDLAKLSVPEWKTQYLEYGKLKKAIERVVDRNETDENTQAWLAAIQKDVRNNRAIGPFFRMLHDECLKVDAFYKAEEEALHDQWSKLETQIDIFSDVHDKDQKKRKKKNSLSCFGSRAVAHDRKLLTTALMESYRKVDMLISFKALNRTGFRKILKKHDKVLKIKTLNYYLDYIIHTLYMFTSKNLDRLQRSIENKYTNVFAQGVRRTAMKHLRVPQNQFVAVRWPLLRGGIFLGVWLTLFCLVIVVWEDTVSTDSENFSRHKQAMFRIFRGQLAWALYPLLLAMNLYNMHKVGVNYELILCFKPKSSFSAKPSLLWETLFEAGAFSMMVWAIVTISFMMTVKLDIVPTAWLPLIVLFFLILALINPREILRTRRSPWSLRTLGRVVSAPFYHVEFRDFLCGDQLTSMVGPLLDLEFTIYYFSFAYATEDTNAVFSPGHKALRACLAAFPAWTRFAQCLRRYHDDAPGTRTLHPHLTNAGKYSCAFLVVTFSSLTTTSDSVFFVLWVLAAILNMCYTLFWDFYMDWGLFRGNPKHPFLRKLLMYPQWTYYAAMCYNVFGRMAWILSISVGFFGYFDRTGLGAFLSLIELMRRFVWNHFRFENEHLNNCGKFRATNEIPLPFEFVRSDEVDFGNEEVLDEVRPHDARIEEVETETETETEKHTKTGTETRTKTETETESGSVHEQLERNTSPDVNSPLLTISKDDHGSNNQHTYLILDGGVSEDVDVDVDTDGNFNEHDNNGNSNGDNDTINVNTQHETGSAMCEDPELHTSLQQLQQRTNQQQHQHQQQHHQQQHQHQQPRERLTHLTFI